MNTKINGIFLKKYFLVIASLSRIKLVDNYKSLKHPSPVSIPCFSRPGPTAQLFRILEVIPIL